MKVAPARRYSLIVRPNMPRAWRCERAPRAAASAIRDSVSSFPTQSSTFAPIKGSAFKAAASAFILAARRYPNIPIRPSSFMLVSPADPIVYGSRGARSGNLTYVFDKTWFFVRLTPRVRSAEKATRVAGARLAQRPPRGTARLGLDGAITALSFASCRMDVD